MSIYSVTPRSFILALFIRDDGERFLLGDNGFDFKDSQLHFSANTIENDEVAKQGADGVMLAGQVRRATTQKFEGYVGDGTTPKETIESMRRDFIAFFAKGHHFRVVYVDCNRNAWQRKGGYLVDAPEVQELWQIHPEYSVGLNFEDVNYYSYDENAEGEEILPNIVDVPVSVDVDGGLVWDEDGAVSEEATVEWDTESTTVSGKVINVNNAVAAPLESVQIKGETSQNGTPTPSAPVPVNTVTGENVVKIYGKNLLSDSLQSTITYSGTTSTINGTTWQVTKSSTGGISLNPRTDFLPVSIPAGTTVAFSSYPVSGTVSSSTTYYQIRCYWYDINKNLLGNTATATTSQDIMSGTHTGTYTPSTDVAYIKLGEYIPSSAGTTSGVVLHLQLEKSSTATAYEPYQGQSYEVNLGKNLFDKDNVNVAHKYPVTAGNGLSSNASAYSIFLPAEEGITYTVSSNSSSLDASAAIFFTSESPTTATTWISRETRTGGATSITATAPSGARYIGVYLIWSTNATTISNLIATVQLEKGSQATTYAAYFEPIELCKIGDYQDYIYKSGGDWYVHKACSHKTIDLTASVGINLDGTNTVRVGYGAILASAKPPAAVNGYFNYATKAAATNWAADNEGYFWDSSNGGFWVRYAKSAVGSTQADVETWLSNKTFELYYALATPTDTKITNQYLIAQLEALVAGNTYAGINNIFTVTNNEVPTLGIGYYTKYDYVITGGGYVWEQGGQGGPTTIINESITDVSPVWTVHGPVQNPILENITTGERIEYVGTIAEGQTLVIDMGEQTALLNGLNVLANVTGDFISLAPGANTLLYVVDDDGDPSQLGWSEIVG